MVLATVNMGFEYLQTYHYFEKKYGPLTSLLKMPYNLAIKVTHKNLTKEAELIKYMQQRIAFEEIIRTSFVKKGGEPNLEYAYYFTIGRKDFVADMYQEPCYIEIPVNLFNPKTISFTYCDSFYAFKRRDDHPTRRKVYTIDEINSIIEKYGKELDVEEWPNYIEMQVWDDVVIRDYLQTTEIKSIKDFK